MSSKDMLISFAFMTVQNLLSRRIRSWLTMIGIFVGIAAVVSLISLGQGMQHTIQEEFEKIGTDKIMITPKGGIGFGMGSEVKLYEKDLDTIERARGVDSVAGVFYTSGGKVEFDNEVKYTYLLGMPLGDQQKLIEEANQYKVDVGRELKKGDKYKAVLGYNFLHKKIFGKPVNLRDKILINDVEFKVVGFYEQIGNPQDDAQVYLDIDVLRDLIDAPEEVSMIFAKTVPGADVDATAEAIKKELRDARGLEEGKEDFSIATPAQALESFNTILLIVQVVLIGIAGISLIVGGIGIMNTMYTSVLEKTRDIGIMKALGAENHDIFIIFLIESGLLGVAGGIIGLLLGIIASYGVSAVVTSYGITMVKAYFPWYLTIGSVVFAFVVGSVSGVFPALQAARLQPVDAIRQG
jgi:putative ABC transport system permease protein